MLQERYSISPASGLSSSWGIPRQTLHPAHECEDTGGISRPRPPSLPKMLEATAVKKTRRDCSQ